MSARVIWITGIPGSGKSVLADALKERIPGIVVLRMDEFRKIVTPSPSYSETERDIVYRAIVFLSRSLSELGHDVALDATGNLRRWRELARSLIPRFAEVYVKCSPEAARQREAGRADRHGAPSKIYQKGESGWPVPGAGAPYEEPLRPDLVLDSDALSVGQETDAVLGLWEKI
ncbi:MAG: adenylyl-sulfate kinase [Phycisphaerae bacterium]|nr:adenylyl-sulfate kinase [Phycisphaerae bacterium]